MSPPWGTPGPPQPWMMLISEKVWGWDHKAGAPGCSTLGITHTGYCERQPALLAKSCWLKEDKTNKQKTTAIKQKWPTKDGGKSMKNKFHFTGRSAKMAWHGNLELRMWGLEAPGGGGWGWVTWFYYTNKNQNTASSCHPLGSVDSAYGAPGTTLLRTPLTDRGRSWQGRRTARAHVTWDNLRDESQPES